MTALDRLYRRLGPRYIHLFIAVAYVVTVVLGFLLAVAGNGYVKASGAELAWQYALTEVGLTVAVGLATLSWTRAARPLDDWIRRRGDTREAAGVWRAVVRLPMLVPLVSFPIGVVFAALPVAVYTWVVVGLAPEEAAVVLASVVAGGAYLSLLCYFALELYLRPVLRDLAGAMPPDFAIERAGTPLTQKLLAVVLLVTGTTGIFIVWVLTAGGASLDELGLGILLTVCVTLSISLVVGMLLTGSLKAPIADLVGAMARVREGDLGARVPLVSDDELGVLGGSFNRMTADLEAARGELVTAREEERRRLRRDLHDGLGPALAGIRMEVEAAERLVDRDPRAARILLERVRATTGEAIADIRRLVYDLRPPQLDQLGLVGAIEERAAQVAAAGDGRLSVTVEAPDPLDALPAAVEVAAYRIVQEALANVVRHSGASGCTIRLVENGALELEVADDGGGLPDGRTAGVGLSSMRERASEVGGTFRVERGPAGGTVVSARLPLATER